MELLDNVGCLIYEFIDIDDNTQTIDVHENETRINIIGGAAEGTSGRTRVNNNATLMLVSCKSMGMTCHKDVYIQLPLEHG